MWIYIDTYKFIKVDTSPIAFQNRAQKAIILSRKLKIYIQMSKKGSKSQNFNTYLYTTSLNSKIMLSKY